MSASLIFFSRDHAGGNENLVSMVSGLTVCGNDDRIGALNKRVKHNESFKVENCGVYFCDYNIIIVVETHSCRGWDASRLEG